MSIRISPANVDRDQLRSGINDKYTDVALAPEKGFHFHTGAPLATMLGYSHGDYADLPRTVSDSFAGTGNPFSMGRLIEGEIVADLGSGAGFDLLQAARMVGPGGRAIGIDMTAAMRAKAAAGAEAMGLRNVEVRDGYLESLPLEDETIDVVISNGVINLTPDKIGVMREVYRVLKPGGRIQIADIVVHIPVPQEAKDDIELWSG